MRNLVIFLTAIALICGGCGSDETQLQDQQLQQSEIRENFQQLKLQRKFAQTAEQKAKAERARDSVEYHRSQLIMFAHTQGYNAEQGDSWEVMLDTMNRQSLREYVRLQRNLSHVRERQVRMLTKLNHYLGQYQFGEDAFENWYAENVKNRGNSVVHATQLADSLTSADLWGRAVQQTRSER